MKVGNKEKRQVLQKTKEYRSERNAKRYAKITEAHWLQLIDAKTGATYKSGVAIKIAKKY